MHENIRHCTGSGNKHTGGYVCRTRACKSAVASRRCKELSTLGSFVHSPLGTDYVRYRGQQNTFVAAVLAKADTCCLQRPRCPILTIRHCRKSVITAEVGQSFVYVSPGQWPIRKTVMPRFSLSLPSLSFLLSFSALLFLLVSFFSRIRAGQQSRTSFLIKFPAFPSYLFLSLSIYLSSSLLLLKGRQSSTDIPPGLI